MRFIFGLFVLIVFGGCNQVKETRIVRNTKKVLIISDKKGWQEETSQLLLQAASQLPESEKLLIDSVSHPIILDEDYLKSFSVLVFINMSMDSIGYQLQADLERYSQAGGGMLHINTDIHLPRTWPWYETILEKEIESGGSPLAQKVSDSKDGVWRKSHQDHERHVLTHLTSANINSPNFSQELLENIQYLIGNNISDYTQVTSLDVPDASRFSKVVLDDEINEPMELAVLPDGRVIYIERRGKMKIYEPEKEQTRLLHEFDVCTSGNYEDGMLGLALDPNFAENQYLYLFYSPGSTCEKSQQLSRFKFFKGDSLILASEKVLLEVAVQRETCCHTGGSITFDSEGHLYLSTGDNTSSKESNGYTPIDERPGRGPFDAQKSSANTHDLRGKVLRIKPTKYGTYTIPEGNLFPKDGSQGRPEIYAMGARNPFRISVDHKTGYVYWGDVGPDAGRDGRYGPQSYDEFNQAREPGYFGWPYFMGNNITFPDRDFVTDEVGSLFDPEHPINNSPHNYGSQELPPAQEAFIWYPKAYSPEFPMLGVGSNSAMAGPVYYQDMHASDSKVKFPPYYNGKLFIYEWARSWIKVVTMDENGDLLKIEPFMPEESFVKPIEMEFGPDGAMYMLEYGASYFADNPEAKLVRIEYAEGNRTPVARASVDRISGAAPFTARFSGKASFDYDKKDILSYEWIFTSDQPEKIWGVDTSFTFEKPGEYHPKLRITDQDGLSSMTELEIFVGNAPPEIEIAFEGNNSFFFDGHSSAYEVAVNDLEDEQNGEIDQDQIQVNFMYLDNQDVLDQLGIDEILSKGDIRYLKGKQLIDGSDCYSCHHLQQKNIGPSYMEVAKRYKEDALAVEYLSDKILKGGNGNWGEKIMAGHPQHTIQEAAEMTRYILSLAEESSVGKQLDIEGSISTSLLPGASVKSAYLLSASYKDKGANDIRPMTTRKNLLLSYPQIEAEAAHERSGGWVSMYGEDRGTAGVNMANGGLLTYRDLDLSGIGSLTLRQLSRSGGKISIRLGGTDGTTIGSISIPQGRDQEWETLSIPIQATTGKKDITLVFETTDGERGVVTVVDWVGFELGEEG